MSAAHPVPVVPRPGAVRCAAFARISLSLVALAALTLLLLFAPALRAEAAPADIDWRAPQSVGCYTLDVYTDPGAAGTFRFDPEENCSDGGPGWDAGTEVAVEVTTEYGYTFSHWDDGTTSNITSIILNSNSALTAYFDRNCYTLNLSAVSTQAPGLSPDMLADWIGPATAVVTGGTVTPDYPPDCNEGTGYYYGEDVTLTATPDTGYTFFQWSGSASGSDNPLDVVIEGDTSVVGEFGPICYSLTADADPPDYGQVDVWPGSNCSNQTGIGYVYGTDVTLTPQPNTGRIFTGWVDGNTDDPRTVTVEDNAAYTANLDDECYTLTTAADPADKGTVTVETQPNCENGTDSFHVGTQVTVQADPTDVAYEFALWDGDFYGPDNPAVITMDADKSVTGYFFQKCFTANTSVYPSNTGYVDITGPASDCGTNGQEGWTYGTKLTFTASPEMTWAFDSWTGDINDTTNPLADVELTDNLNLTANFVPECETVTIDTGQGGGSVQVSPDYNCSNGNMPGWKYGTKLTFQAYPIAGFSFASWGGDLGGASNPVTDYEITQDMTVEAYFNQDCYTVTTGVAPDGGGTVQLSGDPSDCTRGNEPGWTYGLSVSFEAISEPGYSFANWSGDAPEGAGQSFTVTMGHDVSVTANFTRLCYTVDLTVSPSGGGTAAVTTPTNCNNGSKDGWWWDTPLTFEATPAAGYKFTDWSNDVNSSDNPLDIGITDNWSVTANFEPECYTVGFTTNPLEGGGAAVTTTPNCSTGTEDGWTYGTVLTFVASPDTVSGYQFKDWTGDLSGTSASTTLAIHKNLDVIANFELQCLTVSTSVAPGDFGTVTITPVHNCNTGNADGWRYGTLLEFTATPNTGYDFDSWSGDIQDLANPLAGVEITSNMDVTANFTPKCYTVTVEVSPLDTGTVDVTPYSNCYNDDGPGWSYGTKLSFQATADTGYVFANWSGGVTGTADLVTDVEVTGDMSVTANFSPECYQVALSISPTGGGTAKVSTGTNCGSGASAGWTYGTVLTFEATAAPGYIFEEWTGDVVDSETPATGIEITGDMDVTANFSQDCYMVDLDGDPPAGGTAAVTTTPNCHLGNSPGWTYGTLLTFQATANPGYTFAAWSGSFTGTISPKTDVAITGDMSVIASFTQDCYTLSLGVNPTGGGTAEVSTAPDCSTGGQDGWFYGTDVTFVATPDTAAGYQFKGWTGDVTGTNATTTVTIHGSLNVTANFELQCLTVTSHIAPASSGTIEITPSSNCNTGNADGWTYGTELTFKATAATGYVFDSWSGDLVDTAATTTATIYENLDVTANFELQCLTVVTHVSPAAGGEVYVDPAPNCIVGNDDGWTYGTTVTFTATPDTDQGYQFKEWTGDVTGTNATTAVAIHQNLDVTANFELQCLTVTTSVAPADSGTIEITPASNCNTGNADGWTYGSTLSFKATSNPGYTFENWSGDVDDVANPLNDVEITSDMSVTANFSQDCYAVEIAASPVEGGTAEVTTLSNCSTGDAPGWTYGTLLTFQATANPGYTFVNWSGGVTGTDTTVSNVEITGNMSVTANFSQDCYKVTVGVGQGGGGTAQVTPVTNCGLGDTAGWTYGTKLTFTATANAGYTFKDWTGGVTGGGNPVEVTVTGNLSVTANFTQDCYMVGVGVNPPDGGAAQVTTPTNCTAANGSGYIYDTVVSVSATPALLHDFTHWSGGATGTSNPTSATIQGNTTITANFGPDITPPVTTIDSAPPDPSDSSSAVFYFSCNEPACTFQCSLDGTGFSACTDSIGYQGLANGDHIFEVVATDAAGNPDPTPAEHTWTIDVPPLAVTEVTLQQSLDKSSWSPVSGALGNGFVVALDPANPAYYLDATSLTANHPLVNNYYGFKLQQAGLPDGWTQYWTDKGVVENAGGWQGKMWDIVNGYLPYFYLKVTDTGYMLVDGLGFAMLQADDYLQIASDYPLATYSYVGMVNGKEGGSTTMTIPISFIGTDVPEPPQASVEASGGTATLSWPAVTKDASGDFTVATYPVYCSTSPYFAPDPAPGTGNLVQDGPQLSYQFPGLEGGYFCEAQAKNINGRSTTGARAGQFRFGMVLGQ